MMNKSNVDLERAALAALLMDSSQVPVVQQEIGADAFTLPFHRKVFAAIVAAHNSGAQTDAVSIGDQLGDIAGVVSLVSDTLSAPENARVYAERLGEYARSRALQRTLREQLDRLEAGEDVSAGDVVSRVEEVTTAQSRSMSFSDAIDLGMRMIDEGNALDARGRLQFGLPELDDYLPRLAGRGVLAIVSARPSVGKTALINQLQLTCAKRGFVVGALHLEMSAEEVALRAIASEYRVNSYSLANGDQLVIADLAEKVAERNISSLPIIIDDRTYSLSHIVARIAEWKARHQVDLIIIDHLQLIATNPGERKVDALGDITRALKLTAKRLHLPIVLCCQLGRLNERENRKPKLSDLRDSGAIEQDSDIVIALHSDSLETDDDGNRDVHIGVLKNRGGRTGWCRHEYTFNGRYQSFTEGRVRQDGSGAGAGVARKGGSEGGAAAARARFLGGPRRSSGAVWGAPHVSED